MLSNQTTVLLKRHSCILCGPLQHTNGPQTICSVDPVITQQVPSFRSSGNWGQTLGVLMTSMAETKTRRRRALAGDGGHAVVSLVRFTESRGLFFFFAGFLSAGSSLERPGCRLTATGHVLIDANRCGLQQVGGLTSTAPQNAAASAIWWLFVKLKIRFRLGIVL